MAQSEQDLRERRIIEDLLNAKFSISKIAAELGRHRSTVYRDIKRNFYTDEELPDLSGTAHPESALAGKHQPKPSVKK